MVLGPYLFFKVTHKEGGKAGAHFSTHGNATGLEEVFVVKREGVERQNKFRQTEKGGDGQVSLVLAQEVFNGQESVRVGDIGV